MKAIPAHVVFFPSAALHAAIGLPLSVAWMPGAGHAHEMLFGFGLAAVAGNQLGPVGRARLALLFSLWLAARVLFLAAPGSLAAAAANGLFAGLLAWQLAPRLGARVRKWRNRALPLAVVSLCAAALAMQAALRLGAPAVQSTVLLAGVLLMALLMLFMGGRIIAPAAAGYRYREGGDLAARVQPRLEGTLIVLMLGAIVALAAGARAMTGAVLALAAAVAAARLARWQPWTFRRRREIVGMAVGYAWLALGLAALAATLLLGMRTTTALHLVTIGAMGTLTVQVMSLTWTRISRRDPSRLALPAWATALVAAATIARVAADLSPASGPWLTVAATAWTAAYLLLLACFGSMRGRAPLKAGQGNREPERRDDASLG